MKYLIPAVAFFAAIFVTYHVVSGTKDHVRGALSSAVTESSASIRNLGQAPAFSLTNQEGRLVNEEIFSGNLNIVSFFFSSCQGPCPALSRQLVKLQKELEGTKDLQFVSISIDPKRDTPEVLSAYAEKIGADTENWMFLTATDEPTIGKLSREGFRLGLDEAEMIHSTSLVVVDSNKRIRGYFHAFEEESIANLKQTLAVLTKTLPL